MEGYSIRGMLSSSHCYTRVPRKHAWLVATTDNFDVTSRLTNGYAC